MRKHYKIIITFLTIFCILIFIFRIIIRNYKRDKEKEILQKIQPIIQQSYDTSIINQLKRMEEQDSIIEEMLKSMDTLKTKPK